MAAIPRLKTTFAQGNLIAELLRIAGQQVVNSTGYVYEHMCRYIPKEIESRAAYSGKTLDLQKVIDQEHSQAKDYCEVFDLMSEQRDQVMLTFLGHKLLNLMQSSGAGGIFDDACSGLLGHIYLETDKLRWGIVGIISSAGRALELTDITERLQQGGLDLGLKPSSRRKLRQELWRQRKEDNLSWQDLELKIERELKDREINRGLVVVQRFLAFFVQARLLLKVDTKYMINEDYLKEVEATRYWNNDPIKKSTFLDTLQLAYRLWSMHLKLTDVPLPYLRHSVCLDFDITWRRFDEILKKLPTQTGGYILAYSQSRFREKWGIEIGGKNVYYLAVIRQGG